MDYGAGSGVLAVAALLLGAERAVRWMVGGWRGWSGGGATSNRSATVGNSCPPFSQECAYLLPVHHLPPCWCIAQTTPPLSQPAAQVGTDIEPLAVKATRANAALNGVSERLASYQCAGAVWWVVGGARAAGPTAQPDACASSTCCLAVAACC